MRRVVSLSLPTWATDRLRRRLGSAAPPPETPVITAGREGQRRVVLAVDAAARKLGLRPGLPLAQARARIPDIHVVDGDVAGDASALDRLALWALSRYSPVVSPNPPDGLWIDATGASHLFGGEPAMLANIIDRMDRVGFRASAAIADTPGAAHALARFGSGRAVVVETGGLLSALAPLPIAALRLTDEILEGLSRLGFERIGELEATPRPPLALRFGALIGRRLDQAYGRVAEPIDAIVAPHAIRVELAFVEPIGAPSSLALAIERLVESLCGDLETRGLGARRLDLLFHRVDATIVFIRVGTAQPLRHTKRMARLLTDKLETIDPGFGVERMVLSAPLADPLPLRQSATLGRRDAGAELSDLVDILSNRLGAERLYRATPAESDVPERSVMLVSPMAPVSGKTWPSWPRPTRLLKPPERVETMALLPDHPPANFTWRGVRRRIVRADGPERIFGEWWRRDAEVWAVRDYFQVEDEAGERFWLFRQGDGVDPKTGSLSWFLHGIFA